MGLLSSIFFFLGALYPPFPVLRLAFMDANMTFILSFSNLAASAAALALAAVSLRLSLACTSCACASFSGTRRVVEKLAGSLRLSKKIVSTDSVLNACLKRLGAGGAAWAGAGMGAGSGAADRDLDGDSDIGACPWVRLGDVLRRPGALCRCRPETMSSASGIASWLATMSAAMPAAAFAAFATAPAAAGPFCRSQTLL